MCAAGISFLIKALGSWRQAVATGKHQPSESGGHVRHFKNDLQKLLLWIREQQAFELPLSTPEGSPVVFHCCLEHIYLFILQLLFRLERERERKKGNVGFWRGVTKHWGERTFLFFYIDIYTHTHSQSRKWNGKQRQPSLETVEFSLLKNPIVQIPWAAASR